MLEDLAVYLILAPLAASVALMSLGLWLVRSNRALARVRVRDPRRRP